MIAPVLVEVLPMGEPAFDSLDEEIIGSGFSWEFAEEPAPAAAPATNAPVAVLWIPSPGGAHREYFIYRPEPPAKAEPARRPFGFLR